VSANNGEVKSHQVGIDSTRAQTTKRLKNMTIRIPGNYIGIVKQLVNYLDGFTIINGLKLQVKSEKLLVSSIQDKAQELIF